MVVKKLLLFLKDILKIFNHLPIYLDVNNLKGALVLDVKDIITKINKSVDSLEFTTARKYIEENIELVNQNRIHLKSNAREILKFLNEQMESGEKPLTKSEISLLNTLNVYATRFDIRSMKRNIKGNEQLLLKKESINYLNTDARIFLESMGAIKIEK